MWQYFSWGYTPSSQTLQQCPPIIETLILVESIPTNPGFVPVTFGHTGNFIDTDPQLYDNLGSYKFVIESCQTVQGQSRCKSSNEFTLQISDPCGDNAIIPAPIITQMVQPILGYDEINLF